MLGLSATWNGESGTVSNSAVSTSDAYGATASVNYNQVGVSCRLSTKLRLYAAWYRFDFVDEGGRGAYGREAGNSFLFGARATL
jgi:hypothetical protein